MSAVARHTGWISPEEYLVGEHTSEVRHEYVNGHVYAMAGASDDHNRIVGNIHGELRERLRGKRCEPFMADMKVKIPPTFEDIYYYPDVIVVCDPADDAKYYRERPSVILEVLSPESERTDRREKAIVYRLIPGLEVYVLVEQDRMAATVLRRAEPGWQSEILAGAGAILKLENIGVSIPLERLYERTAVVGANRSTSARTGETLDQSLSKA
ncbi:MAG: Uma2 family endonuclease [Verrucomicrobia bacterium]|nr:Uma2 family endonuclease [Verrucomicrobiota bacterium]